MGYHTSHSPRPWPPSPWTTPPLAGSQAHPDQVTGQSLPTPKLLLTPQASLFPLTLILDPGSPKLPKPPHWEVVCRALSAVQPLDAGTGGLEGFPTVELVPHPCPECCLGLLSSTCSGSQTPIPLSWWHLGFHQPWAPPRLCPVSALSRAPHVPLCRVCVGRVGLSVGHQHTWVCSRCHTHTHTPWASGE